MSYMVCIGPCALCSSTFSFNPNLVPSIHIDGAKQLICSGCMTEINIMRKAVGAEPIPIHPDAY